jgi:hypothetical protein
MHVDMQHSIRKYLSSHLDMLDAIKMYETSERHKRDNSEFKRHMKLSIAYSKLIGLQSSMIQEIVEAF